MCKKAHAWCPKPTLQQQSWQQASDSAMTQANLFPARKGEGNKKATKEQTTLENRETTEFCSRTSPWENLDRDNINVNCNIKECNNKLSTTEMKNLTEQELQQHSNADCSFCTDGSVRSIKGSGPGASAATRCVGHHPLENKEPKTCGAVTGQLSFSTLSEQQGVHPALQQIVENPSAHNEKQTLVATDSKSLLMALDQGPLHRHDPTGINHS